MKSVIIRPEDYITKESRAGVHLFLSLYDVPREMRGNYDEQTKEFRIDFVYSDAEASSPTPLDDKITMLVGKNSGKILGFVVHTEKLPNLTISFGLKRTIQDIVGGVRKRAEGLKTFNQKENYRLIESVLEKNRDSLSAAAG
jgi:hypothetical protein